RSGGAPAEASSTLGSSDAGGRGSLLDRANRERLEVDQEGRPLVAREKYVVVGQPLGKPRPDGQPPRRSFVQVRGVEDPEVAAAVHRLELLPGGKWWGNGVGALPGAAEDGAPERLALALGLGP